MATSGTYGFALENVDVIDEVFERCGIDPATVTSRHLRSVRRSIDLSLAELSTLGVHLWAVEEVVLPVVQSTATYAAPAGTMGIMDMIIRRGNLDIEVNPIARDEYYMLPNKDEEGMPNQFYFDRQQGSESVTFWPVPENSTDVVRYYRLRRLQDSGTLSDNPDVPYHFMEAFVALVAAKVAEKYAPEREVALLNKARMKLDQADEEDTQRTPTRTKVRFRRR